MVMERLQKLGKALMGAVAVLPVAALLMGIGYWLDPDGWGTNSVAAAILIKSGAAVLDNLGLVFAIALAFGLTKDSNGAGALSGFIGFTTVTLLLSEKSVAGYQGIDLEKLTDAQKLNWAAEGWSKMGPGNVLVGILVGILAAWTYNHFHATKLPAALAFFSGRRLVPILTSIFSIALAGVLYLLWPLLYGALFHFGEWVVGQGAVGAGLYGFFNRLLIPVGLHHALNAVFWFDVAGINDIGNFWGNTGVLGQTGMYQAGFFPVMMFGLPGAALAMYRNAKDSKKKAVSALLVAAVLASFLTGITEPLEFAFMFLAPVLYLVHAVLTGVSLTIAALLHATAGFNFSAGLIDFILTSRLPMANNPWLLIVLGVVMFAVYFLVFDFLIKKFNFTTPGREDDESTENDPNMTVKASDFNIPLLIEGLGGKDNIEATDHCATRLRLTLADTSKVDEAKIKSTGAVATRVLNKKNVQVIIGTEVQFVHDALAAQVK